MLLQPRLAEQSEMNLESASRCDTNAVHASCLQRLLACLLAVQNLVLVGFSLVWRC